MPAHHGAGERKTFQHEIRSGGATSLQVRRKSRGWLGRSPRRPGLPYPGAFAVASAPATHSPQPAGAKKRRPFACLSHGMRGDGGPGCALKGTAGGAIVAARNCPQARKQSDGGWRCGRAAIAWFIRLIGLRRHRGHGSFGIGRPGIFFVRVAGAKQTTVAPRCP